MHLTFILYVSYIYLIIILYLYAAITIHIHRFRIHTRHAHDAHTSARVCMHTALYNRIAENLYGYKWEDT